MNQQKVRRYIDRILWGDSSMTINWKEIAIVAILGVLCPLIVFGTISDRADNIRQPQAQTTATTEQTLPAQEQMQISVLMDDASIHRMPLEEYITGVVLKEMPASFEPEALKAQAVVARTYTMRRQYSGGKHAGAVVCTDPSCCQGFCSAEAYLNSGNDQTLADKVKKAVEDTEGQILVFEGAPIEATYFSCSGGKTEDAVAVWGSDVPYLKATSSPGEEQAAHYMDTVTFSTEEMLQKLSIDLSQAAPFKIGPITYTAGGGVDKIVICGKEFEGTQLRKLLSLRSTAFVITAAGSNVTVTTKGFGHRVGMSQYGADAMAATGEDYRSILTHYYHGVDLISIDALY